LPSNNVTVQDGADGTNIFLFDVASIGPDGDPLGYSWNQTLSPASTPKNVEKVTTDVTSPEVTAETTLVFELTVTDPVGASGTDLVSVTVDDIDISAPPPESNGGGNATQLWQLILLTEF
jgi:hypothetical protein